MAAMSLSQPSVDDLVKEVSEQRLRATVEKLASYNTRNTLSPELTQAAEWLAGEYRAIPGMQVEIMHYTIPKGRRVPEDKDVVEVVAWLPGSEPPSIQNPQSKIQNRAILAGGHMDSINLGADPLTGRAPGANDDGSGTALALELARVMSKRRWPHTLIFCAFSGEEQGLNGSRALAKRAKAEGWQIDAVLSNDMVGNSSNKLGQKDDRRVRVFSGEYMPAAEGAAGPAARPPHNSRELARFVEWITRGKVRNHGIKLVLRQDRYGRRGDHTPFMEEGFNAIRFVDVYEEYSRQHTPDDLPKDMDWRYLANNTRMNLIAMSSLADAGPAPTNVRIDLKQGHDTTLTWTATPGTRYMVYWRETTSPVWEGSREVGAVDKATIEKVNKDDHFFAVGAVGGVPVVAR